MPVLGNALERADHRVCVSMNLLEMKRIDPRFKKRSDVAQFAASQLGFTMIERHSIPSGDRQVLLDREIPRVRRSGKQACVKGPTASAGVP